MPFFVLLNKELRSILLAPSTWLVTAAFALAQAFSFILSLRNYQTGPMPVDLIYLHFEGLPSLFWLPFLFVFPLVTMKSFSEEERQGTIEPLMTAPIRTKEVVLAKYVSCFLFYLLLWLPTVVFFLLFSKITGESPIHTSSDGSTHWGGYAGAGLILFLLGAAFVAVGCFCSALTGNQLAAAVFTFVILLLQLAIGNLIYVWDDLPPITRGIIEHINSTEHLRRFVAGKISTTTIVYYLSVAAALLYLTHRAFDFRRWQK